MIKTKNGMTTASGTKADLLTDFTGIAESLMRRAPITAEELIKAVKIAEKTVEIADLLEGIEEIDEDEESITVIPEEEESEAEEKTTEEEGKLIVGKFEADDIEGMLEWLKGKLENLGDEIDD